VSAENDRLIAAALDLKARGLRVFPLIPGTKRPAVKEWQKYATLDEAMIRRVWGAKPYNIGVTMGGGFLGLDIDVKDGRQGLASAEALGVEPAGFVVRTPSGGLHVYYSGPDVANSAGKLGPGLDVRSLGGYLVGPGSVIEGNAYVVEADGEPLPVPSSVVHRLTAPEKRRAEATAVDVALDEPASLERAVQYLRHHAPAAVEGLGGDDTTYRVACRLKDLGLSAETALAILAQHWNERCTPPWPLDELNTKVANAYNYGTSASGSAHPSIDFANVKLSAFETSRDTADRARQFALTWACDRRLPLYWLLKNVLPAVGLVLIYGPPKCGKSFLADWLGGCVVTGKPWLGEELRAEKAGALFLLGEGSGTMGLRLKAFELEHNCSIRDLAWATVSDLSSPNVADALERVVREAQGILAAQGKRLRVIVVDTFASAMGIDDENAAPHVTRAMQLLEALAQRWQVCVVVVAHAGKLENGPRGSSAFSAAVDLVLRVQRCDGARGKNATRSVTVTHNRNGPEDGEWFFRLIPVQLPADEEGEPQSSCVVRVTGPPTKSASLADRAAIEAVDRALATHGEQISGHGQAVKRAAVAEALSEVSGKSKHAARRAVERALEALCTEDRYKQFRIGPQWYVAKAGPLNI
jgi:hypothetical protein